MAAFNLGGFFISCTSKDQETGCGPFCGDNQGIEYQQCRQAYFLKQQNVLLEKQTEGLNLKTKNTELNQQIESLQKENELLKIQNQELSQTQSVVSDPTQNTFNSMPALSVAGINIQTQIIYLLAIFIIGVGAGYFLKKLFRKN